MNEFDKIRADGRLAYEFVRWSRLYNLNTLASDTDTGGVFLCTLDELYVLYGYKAQVSDERHDNTWFEIGELLRLLMKSNPTVLEEESAKMNALMASSTISPNALTPNLSTLR